LSNLKFDRYEEVYQFIKSELKENKDYCSQDLVDFFEEVVRNKEKSRYFSREVPSLIQATNLSQTRTQTKHKNYKVLREQIVAEGVKCPVACIRERLTDSPVLTDGNNRLQIVIESTEKKKFGEGIKDESYKIPAIIAPPALASEFIKVLDDIQVVFNEHDASAQNERNSLVQKAIQRAITLSLDLEDSETRESERNFWKRRLKGRTNRQVAGIVTSARSKLQAQNSKILNNSNDEAKRIFANAFGVKDWTLDSGVLNIPQLWIGGKQYSKISIVTMQTNDGSTFDQNVYRGLKREVHQGRIQFQLTNIKNHNGSYQTYFERIVNVFSELNRVFETYYKKFKSFGLSETTSSRLAGEFLPELVIVQPQLTEPLETQELKITGLDSFVTTLPETNKNKNHYIVVSRSQMVRSFENGKDFQPNWIARFKKTEQASSRLSLVK
jgi:hypothetical protein